MSLDKYGRAVPPEGHALGRTLTTDHRPEGRAVTIASPSRRRPSRGVDRQQVAALIGELSRVRLELLCCPHRLSRGTAPMNESIHGERTASELQARVTELIEQQTAISKLLRAIASSPHDLSPSSTPSSTAPHVSVEQTQAPYVSSKKAAFVSWRCEGTPFWLVRCGH